LVRKPFLVALVAVALGGAAVETVEFRAPLIARFLLYDAAVTADPVRVRVDVTGPDGAVSSTGVVWLTEFQAALETTEGGRSYETWISGRYVLMHRPGTQWIGYHAYSVGGGPLDPLVDPGMPLRTMAYAREAWRAVGPRHFRGHDPAFGFDVEVWADGESRPRRIETYERASGRRVRLDFLAWGVRAERALPPESFTLAPDRATALELLWR
jgi:hypothetical protein